MSANERCLRELLPELRSATSDLLNALRRHRELVRDRAEAEIEFFSAWSRDEMSWDAGKRAEQAEVAMNGYNSALREVHDRYERVRRAAFAAQGS